MCPLGSSKNEGLGESKKEESFSINKASLEKNIVESKESFKLSSPVKKETIRKESLVSPFRKEDEPKDYFEEFSPMKILRKEFFEELNPGYMKEPEAKVDELRTERSDVETFSCRKCLYETRVKENLARHERVHDPAIEWHLCERCPYRTSDRKALDHHLDTIHSDQVEWHQCPLCPLKTSRPLSLRDHISLIHNPEAEWFTCSFCYYRSTAKKRLENHLWSKHRLVEIEKL